MTLFFKLESLFLFFAFILGAGLSVAGGTNRAAPFTKTSTLVLEPLYTEHGAVRTRNGKCVTTEKWVPLSGVKGNCYFKNDRHLPTIFLPSTGAEIVFFNFDSSKLDFAEKENLLKFADEIRLILKKWKDAEVTLKIKAIGHTDHLGSMDYNLKLSEKRALAVTRFLRTKITSESKRPGVGVLDRVVVEVVAAGENSPKTDGCRDKKSTTEKIACLSPDRRAEVAVEISVFIPK